MAAVVGRNLFMPISLEFQTYRTLIQDAIKSKFKGNEEALTAHLTALDRYTSLASKIITHQKIHEEYSKGILDLGTKDKINGALLFATMLVVSAVVFYYFSLGVIVSIVPALIGSSRLCEVLAHPTPAQLKEEHAVLEKDSFPPGILGKDEEAEGIDTAMQENVVAVGEFADAVCERRGQATAQEADPREIATLSYQYGRLHAAHEAIKRFRDQLYQPSSADNDL